MVIIKMAIFKKFGSDIYRIGSDKEKYDIELTVHSVVGKFRETSALQVVIKSGT